MTKKKAHLGESFEEYLKEQGTLAETTAIAVKRVLAWQLRQVMAEQRISKNQMAKAMQTSRSQLDGQRSHSTRNVAARRPRAWSRVTHRACLVLVGAGRGLIVSGFARWASSNHPLGVVYSPAGRAPTILISNCRSPPSGRYATYLQMADRMRLFRSNGGCQCQGTKLR